MAAASEGQPPLIQALLRPGAYPHPVKTVELVETHISWVLLTGTFAYKIKKPVRLSFVDAATLAQRVHFCQEELRLNRRLAPSLYLDVVPVLGPEVDATMGAIPLAPASSDPHNHTQSPSHPAHPWIEAAVKMRQFSPNDLLAKQLKENRIDHDQLRTLAWTLGRFHQEAAVASNESPYGRPNSVCEPVFTNLSTLDALVKDPQQRALLAGHRHWAEAEQDRLAPRFWARQRSGNIRECHGDLHCGNIRSQTMGDLEVFDAIDFNPGLRWIDPISEMAFLVMDLGLRGSQQQALELLNAWLECTGAYDGLDLWPWYCAYRAMVRAKVSALQASPTTTAERLQILKADLELYLKTAAANEHPPHGALVLMHGLSGSGKSHLSHQLIGPLKAIRIRSDRERARAFDACGGQPPQFTGDRYRPQVSQWLFHEQLPRLVEPALLSGYSVIVDATFLRQTERHVLTSLAKRMNRPWAIVHSHCSDATAQRRLEQRHREGTDPSEADMSVRLQQHQWIQALTDHELEHTVMADDVTPAAKVANAVAALLNDQARE